MIHYKYDAAGQLTETIYLDKTDTLQQFIDAVAPGKTAATIDWSLVVYPDDLPTYLTDNPRSVTEYNKNGQVKANIDQRGNRTEYRYDDAGRLIETIYPDDTPDDLSDNPRSKSEYNNAGQRVKEIDAQGHATRFVYDNLGRLVATHFADGTKAETIYDALGRRVAAIDQAENKTEYEYDALGRLTDVVQFLNGEEIRTEYGYDESGRLIWQEDANNHRTNYEYDNLGRRTAVELPDTQRSTTEYDAVGNTFSVTDFNGDTITYNYDAQNRLIEKRVGETPIASFTYTPTGQLETITDSRGVTSYSYDELGRLLSRTDPDGPYLTSGASIEYGYDSAGNRTSVTTPTGTIEYAFEEQNRLKTVTDDAGVTSYSYDEVGNLIRTELPNGVVETRTYDELSRLESVSYVKDGTLIASYDYTLDPVGHRRVVEERDGRKVEYEYDDLYRLTKEAIADPVNGNRTIEYTYDAVGNRLSRIDSVEGTTTYVYDESDRLVRKELTLDGNVVRVYEYRYDDNGNTIERIEKDGSNNVIGNATYSWDKENRLVGATTSTGDVISYSYDTDNIRVSSTVNGVTTEYLVDKNRPYAEVLSEYVDDTLAVSYLHGLDLISQERDGSESFYLVDGLGSTRLLTDEGGEVTNAYSYDAFGNLVASSGSIENEFLFAGEQYDESLEQYYLRQRYYDAGIGRFTRRDTYEGRLNEPITLHKYLYGNANPVNYVDPSGFFALTEVLAGSTIIGSLAGAVGGGYYGAYKSGEVFSKETLKFALVGAVGGAAAGAMLGGAFYLTPAGLGPILTRGFQELWRKALTRHSTTAAALIGGFALGFTGGLLEPDYEVTLGTALTTAITIVDDALIRGAIWRRHEIARVVGQGFATQAKVLLKYGQSTTFIALGFLFGFTIGYASGARIRKTYDHQYGLTNN
ncbi:RHS repeat-associated core domain-containing protein [Oxynema aestuarii]|uniref:RHS repeat-associated core domain-containing protein n=1 Tax=Oxynema aestuarii TaxID=2874213 RepID=UPI001FEC04E8